MLILILLPIFRIWFLYRTVLNPLDADANFDPILLLQNLTQSVPIKKKVLEIAVSAVFEPWLWNKLPVYIREAMAMSTFK